MLLIALCTMLLDFSAMQVDQMLAIVDKLHRDSLHSEHLAEKSGYLLR